jgi:hypothetical protein
MWLCAYHLFISYLVTLTLYEKIDKDMVTLSIMTCSDVHAHYPYLSLPTCKNIKNDTWITHGRMLHRYYLCACGYHIYFKRAFAFISTSISGTMLGMTTWNLSGVRSVNSPLYHLFIKFVPPCTLNAW